jgi:hypothetical protein
MVNFSLFFEVLAFSGLGGFEATADGGADERLSAQN